MSGVLIRGDGVAALTCAHLLRRTGLQVSFDKRGRPRLPAILLSDAAQQLISDVFARKDLFIGLPPIRTRIVSWGSAPVALPHSAIVISEADLLDRLAIAENGTAAPPATEPVWTIRTLTPADAHVFGSRQATVYPVELSENAEPCACWIESLANGWLFLITTEPGRAWLLAVGDLAPDTLAGSTLVRQRIAVLGDPAGHFPTAPRIADELSGPGWLACGSAAMAFDPLCGDGTAHAVREAILASAVIGADAAGEARDALRNHYRARLVTAFHRHLALCGEYYRVSPGCPWWETQRRAILEGQAWCRAQIGGSSQFQYRLNGFALERV